MCYNKILIALETSGNNFYLIVASCKAIKDTGCLDRLSIFSMKFLK